jgi:hypothetical protein
VRTQASNRLCTGPSHAAIGVGKDSDGSSSRLDGECMGSRGCLLMLFAVAYSLQLWVLLLVIAHSEKWILGSVCFAESNRIETT